MLLLSASQSSMNKVDNCLAMLAIITLMSCSLHPIARLLLLEQRLLLLLGL